MKFINPLELINPAADFQRERRRLLTDAELTGGWHNERVQLDKSELIAVLDTLQDSETVAHYHLLLRYPQLNNFLTYGDPQLFEAHLPDDPELKNDRFLQFITPFFLEQYHARLRSFILNPAHIGNMQQAIADNSGSVVGAIGSFDAAMQP